MTRRHDELAAGTVELPVSPSPAAASAHRRMRMGAQRCPKRCFRTRPWVPSSGWLEGVLPERIETTELVCQVLSGWAWSGARGGCPTATSEGSADTAPGVRPRRRPRARAASRSRPTDSPTIRTRRPTQHGRCCVRARNTLTSARSPRRPGADGATRHPIHCGACCSGLCGTGAPRERPDARAGPVRDGEGERRARTRPPTRRLVRGSARHDGLARQLRLLDRARR
jgi:hypothetical protein